MKNLNDELSMIRDWREGCGCGVCCARLIGNLEKRLKKQSQPIKITYKRKTKTIKEWSKIIDVPYRVLSTRKSKGWSDKRTIEFPYKPTPPLKTIKYKGQTKTCAEWAAVTGISANVIRNRYFHYNKSAHKTLTEPVRSRNLITGR